MPNPRRGDLRIVSGSTTLEVRVKRPPNALPLVTRSTVPSLNPLINTSGVLDYSQTNPKQGITVDWGDFSEGLGTFLHEVGRYQYGNRVDTRFPGLAFVGPNERADLTGIAANFRVRARIRHSNVNWIMTTDNTDTRVYRTNAGVWQERLNVAGAVGTCLVSFAGVIAVGFGTTANFRFSSDDGATWTASTKAGNSAQMTYAVATPYSSTNPKVWYVRDNNELWSTADLTNAGISAGPSSIGDSSNDEFNSIAIDDTNVLLMGKRHYLYSIDSLGVVSRRTRRMRYFATSDAGAGAGLRNFQDPVQMDDGSLIYPVEDYRLIRYDHGDITEGIEPRVWGPQVIALDLPINALCKVGEWLLCFLGSLTATTLRRTTYAPGGAQLLGNSLSNVSYLYAGRQREDGTWSWHGNMMLAQTYTGLIRFCWYDDDSLNLYMAYSGANLVNNSQSRCLFSASNPLYINEGGANGILSSSQAQIETGIYYQNQPNVLKTLRYLTANVRVSTDASCVISYRVAPDDDTATGFTSIATYTSSATARTGTAVSGDPTFRGMRLRISLNQGLNASDASVFYNCQTTHLFAPPRYDQLTFVIDGVKGKLQNSGAMGVLSTQQIRAGLDTWKDASAPATVTDLESGDQWSMMLDNYEERGTGPKREFTVYAYEVR